VRRLAADERALWEKVIATVRPLHAQAPETALAEPAAPAEAAPKKPRPKPPVKIVATSQPPVQPGTTLDGTWDRRLSRGVVQPDLVVDLHGHGLASAYSLLDSRLEQAVAMGARVLLLITGKPRGGEGESTKRGAIRAAVGDWLNASRHAADIAAVRGAHPRHGGSGALYIVLRKRK
jgi:DNA-nicking Smr family endonuclease